MPVISNAEITVGHVIYKVKISCSADGRFSIPLPTDVAEKCLATEVSADTKQGAISGFRERIGEVSRTSHKIKKKIWYRVATEKGNFKSDRTFNDANIMKLGVAYRIMIYHEYNNEGHTFDADEFEKLGYKANLNNHLPSGWYEVEWTAERERFFKEFVEKLSVLIDQISRFTDNNDVLMKCIDTGKAQLQLGTTKEG